MIEKVKNSRKMENYVFTNSIIKIKTEEITKNGEKFS
jgi:hypothetical protein